MDFGDISKEIMKRWKNLSPEERGVWINKAKEEKLDGKKSMGLCKSISCSNKRLWICLLLREKVQDMHSKMTRLCVFQARFQQESSPRHKAGGFESSTA